jgi:hypothetical protein
VKAEVVDALATRQELPAPQATPIVKWAGGFNAREK